ncbi:MAG: bifunctional phosphoglucose/phosphomannose isomerase [Flavobacteriales bacterium]|nr:bifunctional phosphoglucose/phosphomannose isomerase [Flavobacteriales bacterium]
MKDLVNSFPEQLRTAVEISLNSNLNIGDTEFQNVLINGLGGSGIGATIVVGIVSGDAKVPVSVNKSYAIPSFVNNKTLAIICSYSGNTEETIESFEKCKAKGAEIVCIASGGKILEMAKSNNINYIEIPGGYPPRAAFGLSFIQLLTVFEKYNLVTESYVSKVSNASKLLVDNKEFIIKIAEDAANKLLGKIPVIYSSSENEGVSIRFRQQINENSKMLCWHHVLPEMNHNELVGWRTKNEDLAVVMLKNERDYIRTKERMAFSQNVFSKYTSTIIEIDALGSNQIENTIYLIHITDWISVLLADKKNIDATEVGVIVDLKSRLSEL